MSRTIQAISLILISLVLAAPSLTVGADSDSSYTPDTVSREIVTQAASSEHIEEPIYPMSPERYEKLVSYSQFTNIWRFVQFFVGLATLAIILFSGLSARFRNWTSRLKWKFLAVWAFFAIVMVADYLLNLPVHIYRGFVVEVNYGFMNQTFLQWFGDDLLSLLILLIVGIIPMWFFYKVVTWSKRWWLMFALGAIPFLVFFIIIAPLWISPLFNDFVPLEDKALKLEILALADKAGIEGSDVFQVNASKQSSKISAYVTGLFGSKRIVLYDTLIKNLTYEEIKFVMGHEMGHYVMSHVWQSLGLITLFIMLVLWLINKTIHPIIRRFRDRFGFDQLSDIASLPLLLVMVSIFSFVMQPIINGFSRYLEVQSDRYGMEISGVSSEDAATAFDKLSVLNLSDPDPHPLIEFWFYGHPALKKRIEFVRSYEH